MAASDDVDDLPLPCPRCGYDLRGAIGTVCPECGTTYDAASLHASQIPWQHRREVGRVRAFLATVAMVLRHPVGLAAQASRPVRYRDARRFQVVCVTLAWLALAPGAAWDLWKLRAVADRPNEFQALFAALPPVEASMAALLADASVVAAALGGFFAWLLVATGVATYWLHVPGRPRVLQARGIATAHYAAAAPLAAMPVASAAAWLLLAVESSGDFSSGDNVLLLWIEQVIEALRPVEIVVVGVFNVSVGVLLAVTFVLPLVLPAIVLRRGMHVGWGRVVACVATTLAAWMASFVLLVALPPFLVLYAQLAWHALR